MSSQPHVLIAPDKFKGSLTAREVAEHLAVGLRRVRPDVPTVLMPIADGGDGTVDAAVAAGFTRRTATVMGPVEQPVEAAYAVRGDTAMVELAEASGLRRLPGGVRDPLRATSRGTGELIATAIAAGARRIVLGLGGSACTDGGAGMVSALGVRLFDARGRNLPDGGGALRDLASIDTSGLDSGGVQIVVASDVDNPLLGAHGAAAVYGPQKGASPPQVRLLDEALAHWAKLTAATIGVNVATVPGAGAAGGVGYAALAYLNAKLEPGIDLLLDLLGFADKAHGARLVITGEGALDAQTLRGKAPAGVARAARRHGVAVVAVAGQCTLDPDQLPAAGISCAYALTELEPDPDRSHAEAEPLLERLAARLADDWL